MYQITANGVLLFESADRAISKRVYASYKQLYIWSDVRARYRKG